MPRFLKSSALPLTLALQGLSLALVGFVLTPPSSTEESSRTGTGDLPGIDSRAAANLQIPRDLARQRLPVPKFPDLEESKKEPAPRPSPRTPHSPALEGGKLASLRVESVALAALVSVDTPSPVLNAPDTLRPHELSGGSKRAWLGGSGSNRRGAGHGAGPSDTGDGGDGGWGGSGIGGSGGGSGGYCPTPGGFIGGGGRGRPGGGGSVGRPAGPSGGGGGGKPAGTGAGRGGDREGGGRGGKGKNR